MNWAAIAKAGYEEYLRSSGRESKTWEQLSDMERAGWIAAAHEIGRLALTAFLA